MHPISLFALLFVPKSKGRLLSWYQKHRSQGLVADSNQRVNGQCQFLPQDPIICILVWCVLLYVFVGPLCLNLDGTMPCLVITLSSGTR